VLYQIVGFKLYISHPEKRHTQFLLVSLTLSSWNVSQETMSQTGRSGIFNRADNVVEGMSIDTGACESAPIGQGRGWSPVRYAASTLRKPLRSRHKQSWRILAKEEAVVRLIDT
jgi:hypothetical protein